MTYHIPYLSDLLLLLALVFPSSLNSIIPKPKKNSFLFSMGSLVIVYVILILLTWVLKKGEFFFFNGASVLWYVIAPLFGVLCILLEYGIGAVQLWIKHGKFPKRYSIHSSYASKIDIVSVLFIALLVICEELILRQGILVILLNGFQLSVWSAIAVSAIIYGLNHLFFGLNTIPQKIVSGVIYTSLFYFSGFALFVPVVAHLTQNLLLLVLSKR